MLLAFGVLACGSGSGGGGGFGTGGGGFGNASASGGSGAAGGQPATGGTSPSGGSGGGGGAGPACAPGMPSAFQAAPSPLSVPAPRCGASFDATAKASGPLRWFVSDLDGDHYPDLVAHKDDCDATVGTTHWDRYPGGAAGLAAAPTAFTVPAARCSVSFDAPARSTGPLEYGLLDFSGDGLTDLVVVQDDCDGAVGTARWDLYSSSASGFVAVPSTLALPAARCGVSFDAFARASGALEYALLDLTADHVPDLVVYQDDCDPTVGQTHWDVYAGSAAGFAASPSAYGLPAARCATEWDSLAKASGALGYSLLDVTGDQRPDLLVTKDDCDPAIGQSHWDVYAGSAAGFAAAPKGYSLPAMRCSVEWSTVGKSSGAVYYALFDASCDGLPDLVVTRDDCDANVGKTHWDAYAGSASGLAAQPSAFGLPAPRCGAAFDAPGKANGALHYGLFAWTNTDHLSLLVTSDDCDPSVGSTHWDYYPAK
ncbi:MAG: hypothetical protein U0263_08120 [Polyangiaceae bacterium]